MAEPMDIGDGNDNIGKEDEQQQQQPQQPRGGGQEEHVEDYGVHFRSYIPKDDKLRRLQLPPPAVPDMVKEIGERVKELTQQSLDTDILSLAPKKAAWDLARDMEQRKEVLDRMTEQAIGAMVREKLAKH